MNGSSASDCDVLIAGAGLVGLALAPALSACGLSVALVDRAPIVAREPPATEDWDTRVYAVSPGSESLLRALGAWQLLSPDRITAIETMRIEGDDGGRLNFSAYEIGERALAWVVEERALREALVHVCRSAGVTMHAPRAMASIGWAAEHATMRFEDGGSVTTKLVVGADGLRSRVREAAGIVVTPRSYGQTAVVANYACERAHHGRAYQWFRDDGGILAWLPLPGRRISMVWSAPEPLAQELLALDRAVLAHRVAAAGQDALGVLECITPAAGFPLSFLKLPTVVAHRVALVGDAAHGVHPLAGQGVNLGFGDVEALAATMRERGPIADAGATLLLLRYARRRAEPVHAMQTVTDALAHLFRIKVPVIRLARNLGLDAIERMAPARRLLAQSALR
jgi:2-octaprenylphenol hydroxylase